MRKTKYEVGDKCWIACGLGPDRLIEGKVIQLLVIEGDTTDNYLIVVENCADDYYEVRNWWTMSAKGPKGPLGIWDKETKTKANKGWTAKDGLLG